MTSGVRYEDRAERLQLTSREREVLLHVADGEMNATIGTALHLTEQTIKFHLSNIYKKLGVTGRIQAVTIAVKHGLVACPACSGDRPPLVVIDGVEYVPRSDVGDV